MSLALLDNVLLRSLSDPVLATKGSELTWDEEDTNFVILHDAIKELSAVSVSGIDAYSGGEEYSLGDFVTYNNNTWEYINAIPQTGVTPGTDPTVWQIASQGLFSHQQNTDTYLNFGGANEVSAADLRAFLDAGQYDDSGVVYIDGSRPMTDNLQFTAGNKGLLWNSTSSIKDNSGELTISANDVLTIASVNSDININSPGTITVGSAALVLNYATASTVVYADASKNLISLANGTGALTNNGSGTLTWVAYQSTLVSGTNIKTINGSTLLGSGDLSISGLGDFVGPASSTNNAVVVFDGTTGKLGKNSLLIFNAGAMSGVTTLASTSTNTINTGASNTLPISVERGTGSAAIINFFKTGFTDTGSLFQYSDVNGAITGLTVNATVSDGGVASRVNGSHAAWFFQMDSRSSFNRFNIINISSGGASTTPFTINSAGDVVLTSTTPSTSSTTGALLVAGGAGIAGALGIGGNIILPTVTGTKLGTSTSQLLGLWNATPIAQPTTAIAAATFVANTSLIANDTATWDGYTFGQVVKALRNMGALA